MSDSELRRILRGVIDDLNQGRLRLRSPLRMVKGAVLPALMASSLGLAACETNSVGNAYDARADVENIADGAYGVPDVDAGPDVENFVDAAYMAPFPDADADADLDAEVVDSGPNTLYMGPPPIDP